MLTPFSPAERAIKAEESSGPSAANAVSRPTRGSESAEPGPNMVEPVGEQRRRTRA